MLDWRIAGGLRIFQFVETKPYLTEEFYYDKIKESIKEHCIENEEKRKPLTDERLTEILQEKGYQIARRTVAKYREQLNIPVARLRREI